METETLSRGKEQAAGAARPAPLLQIEGLGKWFGGVNAVADFSLDLYPNDLVGLIGPNGAGKTTIFNLITGVYTPSKGRILFQGESLVGLAPHEINHLGIARTFQNIRLFSAMTVLDNVRTACQAQAGYGLAEGLLRDQRFAAGERAVTARADELLEIFGLEERRAEPASSLPYGEQRRLEIARAMATGPALLLLDEPAAGMNPHESAELMALIHFIRERFGLTILLIEHQMRVVMGICEQITVMDFGEVIARGSPQEIQSNPRVIEAYLGRGVSSMVEKYQGRRNNHESA
jgi:branched-chain amino acid transport system ATP-binding protein